MAPGKGFEPLRPMRATGSRVQRISALPPLIGLLEAWQRAYPRQAFECLLFVKIFCSFARTIKYFLAYDVILLGLGMVRYALLP